MGIKVRTTESYWRLIVSKKHPSMKNKEEDVKQTISNPDEIRKSKSDAKVLLHYKDFSVYYICVVVKVINGEGFIITTYKTDKKKEGVRVWKK